MPKNRIGYDHEHYKKNIERKKLYNRTYNKRFRLASIELLGAKCNQCGFSDLRALQIDHIHGGGTKEIRETTAHYNKMIYESLLSKENKYQLLCANCNWIKRIVNGENRK